MPGPALKYSDIISKVIALKGIGILLDARLLANCVRDIAGSSWGPEMRIAERNLDEGMLATFHEAALKGEDDISAAARAVFDQLRRECGLTEEMSRSIAYGMRDALVRFSRLEGAYDKGERLFESGSYKEALDTFLTLDDYKDSKKMVSECKAMIKLAADYDSAIKDSRSAVEEKQFLRIASKFDELGDFADSRKEASKLKHKARRARDAEKVYRKASSTIEGIDLPSEKYASASEQFDSISWYKDAAKKSAACKAEAVKAAAYEKAVNSLAPEMSAYEIEKAMEAFRKLGDYRDSKKRLHGCSTRLRKQQLYEKAAAVESSAKTVEEYEAARSLFLARGQYKDSSLRAEECARKAAHLREEELCKKEAAYRSAKESFEKAQNISDYKKTLAALIAIPDHQEALDLEVECRHRILALELERYYEQARKTLDTASTSAEFKEAERLFVRAGDFEDAADLAAKAREGAELIEKEAEYIRVCRLMESASCASDYKTAKEDFLGLGNYEDATHLALICEAKETELRAEEEKESNRRRYENAEEKYDKALTSDDYIKAAELYEDLGSYKDSEEMARECRDFAEDLKKDEIYNSAKAEMKSADEGGAHLSKESIYSRAAIAFESIAGWKDADDLAKKCRAKVDSLRKDETYERAKRAMKRAESWETDQDKSEAYIRAAELFESAEGWNDASRLARKCRRCARSLRVPKSLKRVGIGIAGVAIAAVIVLTIGFSSITISDGVVYSHWFGSDTAVVEGAFGNGEYIEIADTVNNRKVVSIKAFAFQNNQTIRSVTIRGKRSSIGFGAFKGCKSLRSLALRGDFETIYESAFENCTSLGSVTIGGDVGVIGDSSFENCPSLAKMTLNGDVKRIGNRAFFGCSSLESISIPESVREIGDFAFMHCDSLQSIDIPISALAGSSAKSYVGVNGVTFAGVGTSEIDALVTDAPIIVTSPTITAISYLGNQKDSFRVTLFNQSDKKIVGARFNVYAWNSQGYRTQIYFDGESSSDKNGALALNFSHDIEPYSEWSLSEEQPGWLISDKCASSIGTMKCVVTHVDYSDGTTWDNQWVTAYEYLIYEY